MPLKTGIGSRYGTLTVLRRAPSKSRHVLWDCRCDCGAEVRLFATNLTTGNFKKCTGSPACHDRVKNHSPQTYAAWHGMIRRCHDPKCKSFKFYGDRGISVCDEWRTSYSKFVSDMGIRPDNLHSIDRIDSSKNYEPVNCRWATKLVQMNNMRSNFMVDYQGERVSLSEAMRRSGSSTKYYTVRSRLLQGWNIVDAIETPARSRPRGKGWAA